MPEITTLPGTKIPANRSDLDDLNFSSATLYIGRNHEDDIERLIKTSFPIAPEPVSQTFGATFGNTTDSTRDGYDPAGGSFGAINNPWSGGALDVPSGPLAQQIVARAMRSIGEPNEHYYGDPNIACAAFVSKVLVDTQSIPKSVATPSARGLRDNLSNHGAVQIVPYNTRIETLTSQGLDRLNPGDILFFHTRKRRGGHTTDGRRPPGVIGHTEVYVGNDQMVGTSSSLRKIKIKSLSQYPSYWFVTAYRLPQKGIKSR